MSSGYDVTDHGLYLLDVIYDVSCVGGPLHVVIDDGNTEDEHLERGLYEDWAIPDMYSERYSPEQISRVNSAAVELLAILRSMTLDERNELLSQHRSRQIKKFQREREARKS